MRRAYLNSDSSQRTTGTKTTAAAPRISFHFIQILRVLPIVFVTVPPLTKAGNGFSIRVEQGQYHCVYAAGYFFSGELEYRQRLVVAGRLSGRRFDADDFFD